MVFLKPATILVAKIITTILNAMAITAKRKMALENDLWVEVPTRLAIKNSRFTGSIGPLMAIEWSKVSFFSQKLGKETVDLESAK